MTPPLLAPNNMLVSEYTNMLEMSRGLGVAFSQQAAYDEDMDIDLEALAYNVRDLRLARRWTMAHLHFYSGVDKGTISLIERKLAKRPTHRTVSGLAAAFGVTLEQLTTWPAHLPRPEPMRQLAPVRTDRADGPSTNGEVTDVSTEPARRTMAPETEPGRVSMAFELSREGWRALLERVGASMRGTDSDAILGTVFLCPADWMPGMADGQLGWIVKLADEADNGVHAWVRYQNQTRAGQFFLRDGRRWFGFEDGGAALADAVRVVAVSRGRWMADD